MFRVPEMKVLDGRGEVLARLCPLTEEDLLDDDLIETLCAWRNRFRGCFFDRRASTRASTARWLASILTRSDAALFLVRSSTGPSLVAHYGLSELTKTSAELSNGLLGVRQPRGDFFLWVQQRVLLFCEELGLRTVYARVLSNNLPALFLHRRCGLEVSERLPFPGQEGVDILVLRRLLGTP